MSMASAVIALMIFFILAPHIHSKLHCLCHLQAFGTIKNGGQVDDCSLISIWPIIRFRLSRQLTQIYGSIELNFHIQIFCFRLARTLSTCTNPSSWHFFYSCFLQLAWNKCHKILLAHMEIVPWKWGKIGAPSVRIFGQTCVLCLCGGQKCGLSLSNQTFVIACLINFDALPFFPFMFCPLKMRAIAETWTTKIGQAHHHHGLRMKRWAFL